MLKGTKKKKKKVFVVEKVEPISVADESFKIFTSFFVLRCFMKIFKSDLRFQSSPLESAQLFGMCKLSFSESKLLVHLWKSGSLQGAQHPKENPTRGIQNHSLLLKVFTQITGTGQA